MRVPAMGPWLRKAVLTAHVTSSLGWFGAVAAFLALAIAGSAWAAFLIPPQLVAWDGDVAPSSWSGLSEGLAAQHVGQEGLTHDDDEEETHP